MGINFPASPIVGQKHPQPAVAGIPVYTWDGEKWTTVGGSIAAYAPPADAVPLMDATPGLVGTTTEYAREDHVHPTDTTRMPMTAFASSLAYSGMQINGGMEVNQVYGTDIHSSSGGTAYIADQWQIQTFGPQVLNSQKGPSGLSGIPNCLTLTTTTANATPSATDFCSISQPIEGYRFSRLAWGTSAAVPLTICFWFQANRTGNYSISVSCASDTRSCPGSFTVNSSNTWEYKTVTIPPDTGGTWRTDNQKACDLCFTAMAGSSRTSAAGVWLTTGNVVGVTGTINGVASTSDTFSITGVTVLPGTQAPTAAQSPNIMRPYDQELVTCQRYLVTNIAVAVDFYNGTGIHAMQVTYPVTMRATPTWNFGTPLLTGGVSTFAGVGPSTPTGTCLQATGAANSRIYWYGLCTADARL